MRTRPSAYLLGVTLLLLVAASGCVSSHSGPTLSPASFIVGKTTFRDVISVWGNPDSIKGHEGIWREVVTTGGKVKAAYMMIGFTLSNSHGTTREHRLRFSSAGVLEAIRTVSAVPDGPRWSLWPW